MGLKRFINGGLWNIFDAFVVLGCILLFIAMLLSRSGTVLVLEEISEEILLITWSLF
jgi:lipoprotein signal peptidase